MYDSKNTILQKYRTTMNVVPDTRLSNCRLTSKDIRDDKRKPIYKSRVILVQGIDIMVKPW